MVVLSFTQKQICFFLNNNYVANPNKRRNKINAASKNKN